MYGMIKESLRRMGCPDCGSVRAPLAELVESDYAIVDECVAMIQAAVARKQPEVFPAAFAFIKEC